MRQHSSRPARLARHRHAITGEFRGSPPVCRSLLTLLSSLTFLALLVAILGPVPVMASPTYQVFTLDNGLRVLIKELPSAPVVSLNVWIQVGSRNEKPGEEGYAHLMEHMLFKGTPTYPTGTLDREIKKLGASNNAFTSFDNTCTYIVGAKEHFPRLMELLADSALNSSLPEEELKKEIGVVTEELRMDFDNPEYYVDNILSETAFKVHPYRHPIVGYRETLASTTRDMLNGFYRRNYVPSNMWAVIVGDVKTADALEIVKKTMGAAPKVAPPEDKIPAEPPQDGSREEIRYGDIQQAYVTIAWPAPGIESADQFAVDLFSSIMGQGRSSRLYQALVEKERLATTISTSYYTAKDPYLFRVDATCPQSNARRLIDRIGKLMQEVKMGGVTPEELDKAKQMMIASTIFGKETAEAQAGHYGYYATLGKLDEADRYISRIRETTADDVKRVAGQYIVEKTQNTIRYEPQAASDSAKPQMLTLENGVRLILKENHSSPLVGVSVHIDAGGLRETKNQAGLANLTASTLLKGTEKRSAEEIHQILDRLGTKLSVSPGKSLISLKMRTLTENFLPSLELVTEILTMPAFEEGECRKEQEKALEHLKEEQDDLFPRTLYLTLDKLFPDYPLGYSAYGIPDQLRKLKRTDVTQFHKKHFVGSGIVIAIVGDFYTAEVRDRLGGLLGAIPAGELPEMKEKSFTQISKPVEVTDKLNREQAQVMVALRAFPKKDSRGPAMDIIESILSGSMSSRLFTNLRDKESLAYSVSGRFAGSRATGYFYATLSTKAAQAEQARNRLIEELDTFGKKGFSEEEFNDAKNYILGQYALSLVGNLEQAEVFCYDEFMGLGYDYFEKYPAQIRQTTKEEVLKVAGEFFLGTNGYIVGLTRP